LEVRVVNIVVKDSAGLVSAMKAAQSGDVIQLASGNYSGFGVRDVQANGVTITSLDPSKEAVLTGFNLSNVSGFTFKGLELTVNPSGADNPFLIYGSKNLVLDDLNVHGSLDSDGRNDAAAILVRASDGVTIKNSEFHDLKMGISHLDDRNVTITNNSFHDIRIDGVRGGGSSDVTITKNYFTNFHSVDGDHSDGIQFWTSNVTTLTKNITVSDNVMVRGAGTAFQGVFMRDETHHGYENVQVTNNLVVGSLYHGITIDSATGVKVTGNTVAGLPDQMSWIRIVNSNGVAVSGNSTTMLDVASNTNVTQSGNTTLTAPADGGKLLLQNWLATHTSIYSGLATTNLTAVADSSVAAIEATRLEVVTLTGTDGADRMSADGVHNMSMVAGAGNDYISSGGLSHSTMVGGTGDDTYQVKNEFDRVIEDAGAGNDTVYTTVDFILPENVEVLRLSGLSLEGQGNALDNKMYGSAGNDRLLGLGGGDNIQGLDGNDLLVGGDGADAVTGGLGNDTITGDADADSLKGNEGSDSISGGAGSDTIEAGVGADTMSGGTGADQFFFRDGDISSTPDVILDFNRAEGDKISLSMIDANVNVAADQKFAFIGTAGFHKVAGEMRYDMVGTEAHIQFDTNGDGVGDLKLIVGVGGSLQSSDFLL
jgi:Ca2+-binding RTX toxin-like protein